MRVSGRNATDQPNLATTAVCRSPSLCGQKPTKLVKGEHTAIPRGGGHFRLVKKLYSGNSG
jgi:hypothetical protein